MEPDREQEVASEHVASGSRLVVSGRYQNASEVLREGSRLIELREAEDKLRLTALKKAARLGMADINAGAYDSFDSPAGLKRRLTVLRAKVLCT